MSSLSIATQEKAALALQLPPSCSSWATSTMWMTAYASMATSGSLAAKVLASRAS